MYSALKKYLQNMTENSYHILKDKLMEGRRVKKKDLSWVHLLGSHWDEKMELHWDLQIQL